MFKISRCYFQQTICQRPELKYILHDPDSITQFVWNDGSPVISTGQLLGHLCRLCHDSQWTDITCWMAVWFICQKLQVCPVEYLHQEILSVKRGPECNFYSFKDQMGITTSKLNNAETELKYLHDN